MMKRGKGPRSGSQQAFRFMLYAVSAAVLSACGGGSDNGSGPGATPSVAGKITYDYVPTVVAASADGTEQGGLDYAKTERRPVRRALVELVSEDGATVLGKATTDDIGAYSIAVPGGKRAYLRVTAQASEGAGNVPDYEIGIRDNTAPEYETDPASAPLYSMRGNVFTTVSAATQLDLNAGSGWTGNNYGAPRTAAPFAILDQIVNAAQQLHRAEPAVLLPALNVFWSVNNRPTPGKVSDGFIKTSHYQHAQHNKGLYILGAENVDTDEYDASVVVHEFGHYVEANVSRSDNIGGGHGPGELLDMRVAFGEAWGNAFSSMMRGTPVYTDTAGPKQAQLGLVMRLDQVLAEEAKIWANEFAVGNFLYSISQAPEIGFAPIYSTMLTGEKTTPALTSAFSFAAALRPGLSDAGKRRLDQLLGAIAIQGGDQLDAWGTQTKSQGGPADANPAVFPIYVPLTIGRTVTACVTSQFGTGNKLGNYRHLHVTVPAAGKYVFKTVPAESGDLNDYGVAAFNRGKELPDLSADSVTTTTIDFPAAGDYVADVVSARDIADGAEPDTAPHCADVSLQAANQ